jgi:hypothetical protein
LKVVQPKPASIFPSITAWVMATQPVRWGVMSARIFPTIRASPPGASSPA